jgi:hypothetical protein
MRLSFAEKMNQCPQCDSSRVRRSHRRGFLERVLFRILFVWPYRCDACDVRFLGFYRQCVRARMRGAECGERSFFPSHLSAEIDKHPGTQ